MGFVYIILNTVNEKVYIGQTTEVLLCSRWKTHTYNGREYTKAKNNPEYVPKLKCGNSHLYNAMALYGVDKFYIEPLEVIDDPDELNVQEAFYIQMYDSIKSGYNIREGGNRTEHSEETKELISRNTKAAFEKIEVVNNMRKHHDKLEGLPPKCTYGMANKRACYRVRRHPLVQDKCFYVCGFPSEEACRAALIDYVTNVRAPRPIGK